MRRLLIAALLAIGALSTGFLMFLDAAADEPEPPLRRTELVAVLTGGAERIETGLDLLEAGAAPRLFVTGVGRGTGIGDLARLHRRDAAAMADRVTLGHAAVSTLGNAQELTEFLREQRIRSVRVVTAGYHMPRALLELRRAMPEVEWVPHPVQPAALRGREALTRPRTWTLLFGEYLKYLAAAAGISGMFPAREGVRG